MTCAHTVFDIEHVVSVASRPLLAMKSLSELKGPSRPPPRMGQLWSYSSAQSRNSLLFKLSLEGHAQVVPGKKGPINRA